MVMKKILYIHGFASAGSTGSATQLRNHYYPLGVEVLSPDVPVSPLEAMAYLKQFVADNAPDVIVATSMGALYAEQLRGISRILVNPSFDMARLLTFRGMGRQEFRNKRQDGAKDFKVDKVMIDGFREVQRHSFEGITPEERNIVYGLFGKHDKNVNCQPQFKKHYGTANFRIFDGEHYLNGKILDNEVIPIIDEVLRF